MAMPAFRAHPEGVKVYSQGRKPLETVPPLEEAPQGRRSVGRPVVLVGRAGPFAPSGLMDVGGVCTRGLRPWLQTCAPLGHGGAARSRDQSQPLGHGARLVRVTRRGRWGMGARLVRVTRRGRWGMGRGSFA
jgi:hypothetical protein